MSNQNRRKDKNLPGNGGQYAAKNHDTDDTVTLTEPLPQVLRRSIKDAPKQSEYEEEDSQCPDWYSETNTAQITNPEFCWRTRKLLRADDSTPVEVIESKESARMYSFGETWESSEEIVIRCGDKERTFSGISAAISRLERVSDDDNPESSTWNSENLHEHMHQVRDFTFKDGSTFRGKLGNYYLGDNPQLYLSGEMKDLVMYGSQLPLNWNYLDDSRARVELRPMSVSLDRIDRVPGIEDEPLGDSLERGSHSRKVGGVRVGDRFSSLKDVEFLAPIGEQLSELDMEGSLTRDSLENIHWDNDKPSLSVIAFRETGGGDQYTVDFLDYTGKDGLAALIHSHVKQEAFDASLKESEGLATYRSQGETKLSSGNQRVKLNFTNDGEPQFFSDNWDSEGEPMTPAQASRRLNLKGRGASRRLVENLKYAWQQSQEI